MRREFSYAICAGAFLTVLPAISHSEDQIELELLGEFPLFDRNAGLLEPSGLTMNPQARSLWVVSDNTGLVFQVDFTGRLVPGGERNTGEIQLEGLAVLPDGTFAAVRESTREILIFDGADGRIVKRVSIVSLPGYDEVRDDFDRDPDNEKGLEGLAYDSGTDSLLALKEGQPRLLLAIAADLSRITEVHRLTRENGFRVDGESDEELDVSGIVHDPVRDRYWILSDEGSRLFLYDPGDRKAFGAKLTRRKSDGDLGKLKDAEGIALHPDGDILFVATDDDDESRLAVYRASTSSN